MSNRVRLPWSPIVGALVLVVVSLILAALIVPKVDTDSMLPEAIDRLIFDGVMPLNWQNWPMSR